MQINTGSPLEHPWVLASASLVPAAFQCTCGSSGLSVWSVQWYPSVLTESCLEVIRSGHFPACDPLCIQLVWWELFELNWFHFNCNPRYTKTIMVLISKACTEWYWSTLCTLAQGEGRALLSRTGHVCVEPCIFVSNRAFLVSNECYNDKYCHLCNLFFIYFICTHGITWLEKFVLPCTIETVLTFLNQFVLGYPKPTHGTIHSGRFTIQFVSLNMFQFERLKTVGRKS